MSSIYFPLAALLIDLLVMYIFFSKKFSINRETKIYSVLTIVNFFQCVFDIIGITYVKMTNDISLFSVLQKIDMVTIILWAYLMFIYVYGISEFNEKNKKIVKILFLVMSFVCSFLTLVLENIPIVLNDTIDSSGAASIFAYGSVALFAILIFICVIYSIIKNRANIKNKKYYPLYSLILLALIGLVFRTLFPSIIFEPFIMGYVILIMYFTIENPDMKMIEELNIAKDQVDKANMAKSDFLSSMSHEIRTPLNAIVGFSDAIESANTLEEAKENAKDVISASNTLLEIVNGVLDISKIEAGKLEIVNSDYNTYELLNSVARLLKPRMEEKGLEFKINIASDIPAVLYGDHTNLKKAITNILTNACKYTDKGSVEYKVSCVNTSDTTRLLITVEDTGRGIKKEKIDKLFTRFQRLEEDRNTTIEGTGLGLAITKKILDLMGGTIVVQSVYGSGSKFTIALDQKIKSMVLDVEEKQTVKNEIDLTNKKILIVDDNKLNLKVAAKFLSNYNPIIETVESGFECIDKIKNNNKYDLILMDDMMPKMSGVETLQELKKLEKFNIPVVALTANAVSGMRDKYIKDGFNDYLAKPIDKGELKRVLSNLVILDYEQPESILGEIPNELFVITDEDMEKIKNIEVPNKSEDNKIIETSEKEVNIKNNDYLVQNGIDLNKSLELLGDMDTYNDTIEEFYNNLEDRIKKLENYKTNDMPNYAIEVHALKSDSKYLGFTKLAELAYDHEMKSKANEIEYINNTYDTLMAEVNKIKEIIKNYLGK